MCKSEYKLIRKMQWDGDVLKVQDTMHDVLREAKQAAEDAMTGEVLSHFECDFSDFREYMHDKIKWERKQELAMPRWIPVTERLPETNEKVLVWVYDPDFYKPYMDFGYWLNEIEAWGEYNDEVGDFKYFTIKAWMPLPQRPKETDGDEQTSETV